VSGAGIQSSNIGGFHSARTLLDQQSVQSANLPLTFMQALTKVEAYEAELTNLLPELSRPTKLACTEGWLNVSGRRNWNHLHNHAGFTYAGVYFVDDGGSLDGDNNFAGRLYLLAGAPAEMSKDDWMHMHPRSQMHPRTELELEEQEIRYVKIDPVPGTIVIFPSYVPHFVLPVETSPVSDGIEEARDGAPRISVAFNASCLDPWHESQPTCRESAHLGMEAPEEDADSPLQAFFSGKV
jgi:hypothetical protein